MKILVVEFQVWETKILGIPKKSEGLFDNFLRWNDSDPAKAGAIFTQFFFSNLTYIRAATVKLSQANSNILPQFFFDWLFLMKAY